MMGEGKKRKKGNSITIAQIHCEQSEKMFVDELVWLCPYTHIDGVMCGADG